MGRYDSRGLGFLVRAAGDFFAQSAKKLRKDAKAAKKAKRAGQVTAPGAAPTASPVESTKSTIDELDELMKNFPQPNNSVTLARPIVPAGGATHATPSATPAAKPQTWEDYQAKLKAEGILGAGPPPPGLRPPAPAPTSHVEAADQARAAADAEERAAAEKELGGP